MFASIHKVLFAGLFAAIVGASSLAHAQGFGQGSPQIRLMPQPGVGQPRLGFNGHFEWGRGMVVDSVPWGTPAAQAGLEPGDVIRAMNGRWISSLDEYFWILRNSGGQVRLVVEDVRTGMLVNRSVFLNGGQIPLMRNQRTSGISIGIGAW